MVVEIAAPAGKAGTTSASRRAASATDCWAIFEPEVR
jgi:hypothetical protein